MDSGSGAGGGGNASAGAELEQIETEQLAFQAASGEDKLRLLPSAWPADNLPSTTSSLLSVASTQGLLAAAGPDCVVITTTDSVRETFINEKADAETKVKSYTPEVKILVPRVSQVAFSSDESCLVIAAEQGGGLAVYDTNALKNGNTEAAFQLGTEGESVRQLLPNPNPAENTSHLFVVVTANGKLLLADLKERKLAAGSNGSWVLCESVSCAGWSRLGKQIVAGLANGTAVQLDQAGAVKAQIPEPPQLAQLKNPASTALPITSIYWIETHDFLIIHTPVNPPDSGADDDSTYHLAHRDRQTNAWTFNKFVDPCLPFGLERRPAHHFVQRLRDWANLDELIILASTASTDIGLFTRSKEPLDPQQPITDVFTYTQPPDQSRAAMPMGEIGDTSPIGMAMDMSVKEKVTKPIPNDETLDESPVPLPALYVLNNEGMLSMWWVIYNESVRQSKPYPDLIAAGGPRPLEQPKQQQSAPTHAHPSAPAQQASTPSAFSSFAPTSNTPAQAKPAFGQSSFGAPSTPAFGGASSLTNRQSAWAAPSSTTPGGGAQFGNSAFGQPSTFGASGFGQAGGMGASKASVWGTPSQSGQQTPTAGTGSVFGGGTSQQQQSPFMSLGGNKAPSSFAALGGGSKESKPSPFASATTKPSLSAEPSGSTISSFGNATSFGSGSTTFGIQSQSSLFGSPAPNTAGGTFGKPSAPASKEESMVDENDTSDTTSTPKPPSNTQDTGKSPFGLGSGGFKLGSTFKGDGTAKEDLQEPKDAGAGLFGKAFGNTLGDVGQASSGPNSGGAAWWSGSSTPAVKKESESDGEGPKLSDIPPAEPAKDEQKAAPVDDAPLPPDPTTWKPKPGALPAPVPPGFGADFAKSAKSDDEESKDSAPKDTPLPPAFASAGKNAEEGKQGGEGPLAGSPPVDLGQEKFSESVASGSEAAGPQEDEWSDEEEEGEEEGDEDENAEEEGEEDEDESEEHGTPEITDPKGLSAFESRLTPASPKRAEAKEESTTPATDTKSSYTPAGMPKAPVMFAPPQRRGQESPRSPSPVRSATSPLRPLPSLTSTQPPTSKPQPQPSRTPSSQQQPFAQSRSTSQAQPPQRIAVPPAQLAQRQQQQHSAPPQPSEPTAGELQDEEDARIQAILAAPIEPSKEVPAFLAHQDYTANGGEKPGLGGQIERVFRDINSMIDTLALNARSLRGFVEGNLGENEEAKGRGELEGEEPWLLGEAVELTAIVDGIEVELEDGRVEDVRETLETLREDEMERSKLKLRVDEAKKRLQARRDPDQLAQQRNAPLPMETQTMQAGLRQEVQRVQKQLAKAEELLSVLRAELASRPQSSGAVDGRNGGVPTVEAVEKTIRKMTKMVEERSGDIDVLEAKIRRLGGPSALDLNGDYEDDLVAGLKASRLSSSSPAAMRASRMSPRRSQRAGTPGPMGSMGRKSLFDVSNEEVEAFRLKKDARKRAMERLKETVERRGPRVVRAAEA